MDKRKRIWALIFLAVAVGGLLLLASGLPGIALSKDWGIPDLIPDASSRGTQTTGDGILDRLPTISRSLLQIVFMTTILFLPLALFFSLFSKEVRQALLQELKKAVPIIIWMLTLFYLLRRLQMNQNLAPAPSFATGADRPPDWITNPTPFVAFLVGSLLLVLISIIVWYVWKRTRPNRLNLIAREAQATIDELQAGRDFKNAIIECYYRMCEVLSEQQHIERAQSMTPREFASRLGMLGIGGSAAHRLTDLFESARYGPVDRVGPEDHGMGSFGEAEEREAIDCLKTVIETAAGEMGALSPETRHFIIGSG